MSATSVRTARKVTDEEVAHFLEHGWVYLPGLVAPEVAGEMLAEGKKVIGENPQGSDAVVKHLANRDMKAATAALHRKGEFAEKGSVTDAVWWQDYHSIARDDKVEPFHSFSFSKEMGANVQRLMDRDVSVRYYDDFIAVKMPAGQAGGAPTGWHQDYTTNPLDRTGAMSVWMALDDLPPEKGTMRFLSGAFREGPLGGGRREEMFTTYPKLLEKYKLSDPLHMKPGDATVHGLLTPHYAPANETDTPRWGFVTFYCPGDTLYNGSPRANFEGTGIEPFMPLDHPSFPIVYP